MKADQRKQLETNVLADRVGRLMQNIKKGPSRKGMWLVIAAIAVPVALIVFFLYRNNQARASSELWEAVNSEDVRRFVQGFTNDGRPALKEDVKNTNQSKVIRFHLAWDSLWNRGIQSLYKTSFSMRGTPSVNPEALKAVKAALEMYEELYQECKDDKVLGAEALYNRGVAQETLAIDTMGNLETAKTTYNKVVEEFKDSSYAKEASQRLKVFSDPKSYDEVRSFYQNLSVTYHLNSGSHFDEKKLQELLKKLKVQGQ